LLLLLILYVFDNAPSVVRKKKTNCGSGNGLYYCKHSGMDLMGMKPDP